MINNSEEGIIKGGSKTTTIDIVAIVTAFAIATAEPPVIGIFAIATTLRKVSGSANGWHRNMNRECAQGTFSTRSCVGWRDLYRKIYSTNYRLHLGTAATL
jgi:hypothetical protein